MSISSSTLPNFSPPAFKAGLANWSSGDGTSGSESYGAVSEAAYVPNDSDFSGCLELIKTRSVQKLRAFAKTPMRPETYLRISTRIKSVTGNLPAVRIAGWAGNDSDAWVSAATQIGPSVALSAAGEVVEISAIVGPGLRDGVDMVWGSEPTYGHFGLDLTGASGGIVRIDDFEIQDVTGLFHREMINVVDVRDYGALGDDQTDNYNAFVAADQAANGRQLLVPEGTYHITRGLSLSAPVQIQGQLVMPDDAPLVLSKSYNLSTYIDAFKSEELAFKKAFQALLNSGDHDSLDLSGRSIAVSEPIDMQAAVANRTEYAQRRVIRNGQFYAQGDTAWENEVVNSVATYSQNTPKVLKNVVDIANIPVGALVEGHGVGREIYVKSKNVAAQEVTLSEGLFDADGTQNFNFTRFKYLLDFSGFEKLSKFSLQNIEFQCNSKASGIMLARTGYVFHIKDCFITRPKYRGLTSIGTACQGMLVDRCHFMTAEPNTKSQDRISIAINANGNDVKLRENWASQFRHFAILSGSNNIVSGNHFYQGDGVANGIRLAGLAMTKSNTATTVVGNYVDNCFLEWTNEHDPTPDFTSGFGFSALSVSDNVFLSGNVADWFAYLVVKPFGSGHGISNLSVNGNTFRSINGTIDRVERIDTSYADIDRTRLWHIQFMGNNFNNIKTRSQNPLRLSHSQNSASSVWSIETDGQLPFGGYARDVEALVAKSEIKSSSNQKTYNMPYVTLEKGSARDRVNLNWPEAVKGKMGIKIRCDR